MHRIQLRLTPHRHLLLEDTDDGPVLDDQVAARLAAAFGQGTGYGLLRLGAGEVGQALPPAFVWWRDFAVRYVGAVCLHASGAASDAPPAAILSSVPPPAESDVANLLVTAPMMRQERPTNSVPRA
jgi:hypothetical protein